MKKNKRKQNCAPRCPYCGSHSILKSAEGIYKNNSRDTMLYVCKNYPVCDSYVRVHLGTKIPMGTMANGELRRLRYEAHKYFNQLYESGYMTKDDAYRWLAAILCAPQNQAHIGLLGEYYCKMVIEESKKLLSGQTVQFITGVSIPIFTEKVVQNEAFFSSIKTDNISEFKNLTQQCFLRRRRCRVLGGSAGNSIRNATFLFCRCSDKSSNVL